MKVRQEIYDTYWKTAYERQEIFFKKLYSRTPFTGDSVFSRYKFCNVYRASDRVSQYLIRNIIYSGTYSDIDTIFRIFLFRLLNKNETWSILEKKLGKVSLTNFTFDRYVKAFEEIKIEQKTLYGNAFILCANKVFGFDQKHENHIALLEYVFKKSLFVKRIYQAPSLARLFEILRELPLIGTFMAYQIAIDLNYSEVFQFDEDDFTIAGPGAVRGIRKCFRDTEGKNSEYVIQYMVENQEKEFERLGLMFRSLWGRRMHAIDCQGWFCETDKYCRVKYPELKSNRIRMKAEYKKTGTPIDYFYPPKWGINEAIPATV